MEKYYQILWIEFWASEEEIKKAYRKLSIQYHPDKWWNEYLFKQINEAYDFFKKNNFWKNFHKENEKEEKNKEQNWNNININISINFDIFIKIFKDLFNKLTKILPGFIKFIIYIPAFIIVLIISIIEFVFILAKDIIKLIIYFLWKVMVVLYILTIPTIFFLIKEIYFNNNREDFIIYPFIFIIPYFIAMSIFIIYLKVKWKAIFYFEIKNKL